MFRAVDRFRKISAKNRFFLGLVLGLWSVLLYGSSGYAESYVALFPASPPQEAAHITTLLRTHSLTEQTREILPHLQGALLELDSSQKEELLRNLPGTLLISGSRTFHHCAELEKNSPQEPQVAAIRPWHVAWAQNARLDENISDAAWRTVVIAVLDTGVNPHRDFSDASILWNLSYNALTGASGYQSAVYDDQGHGTAVTGTIVGKETGITPKVSIVPVKCADSTGNSSIEDLARSLDYLLGLLSGSLANRHLICNFSFATSGSFYRDNEMETFFHNLFDRIASAGGLFISAAGNDSLDVNRRYVYPSRVSSAIFLAAASTTEAGFLADSFSNYGNKAIDVAAPGNAITTTSRNEVDLETLNGTSFSSPIVAGVTAALWAREQGLANWQVRNVLLNAVDYPLWTSQAAFSPSANVPVIAGGDMVPARFLETSFVASARGTTPKALNLVDPSEDDSGGGCSTGTRLPGFLILLPLLWSLYSGEKHPRSFF